MTFPPEELAGGHQMQGLGLRRVAMVGSLLSASHQVADRTKDPASCAGRIIHSGIAEDKTGPLMLIGRVKLEEISSLFGDADLVHSKYI